METKEKTNKGYESQLNEYIAKKKKKKIDKICLIKKLVFIFAHRKRSLSTQLIKKGGWN